MYRTNDDKLEVLLLGSSLVSTDGKVVGFDKFIDWDYLVVK